MIGLMQIPDINEVLELWTSFMKEVYPSVDILKYKDEYKAIYETSNVYVYRDDTMILGFLAVVEGSYVDALYVKPECRRQGIASNLVKEVQNRYDDLITDVPTKCLGIHELLINTGFKIDSESVNEILEIEEKSYFWER